MTRTRQLGTITRTIFGGTNTLPVFPRLPSSLFNLSLNILSRLFTSHTPQLLPKTLKHRVSQRRNAEALQTGVHSSIIFLRKTSGLYHSSNDYTGFHCIHTYICTLSTYYDTFPNHLVRLNISPNNFQTLLQRIETRDINPVFTWYLPYIFIFTPIPNASVIKVLTLSIIFPYLCPLSRFPPRYHPP